MRGDNFNPFLVAAHHLRITPTCVGTTLHLRYGSLFIQDHPHVRGDNGLGSC